MHLINYYGISLHPSIFLSSDISFGLDRGHLDQIVPISDDFVSFKGIVTLIFNALGRGNEHQRSDRDQHVEVIWKNVKSGHY